VSQPPKHLPCRLALALAPGDQARLLKRRLDVIARAARVPGGHLRAQLAAKLTRRYPLDQRAG
jgi:hypothetical protein